MLTHVFISRFCRTPFEHRSVDPARLRSTTASSPPGKSDTLLNRCGIKTDFLDYTVDHNPHDPARYLSGPQISIDVVERIDDAKPNYVRILPWNTKAEILAQTAQVRELGAEPMAPVVL